ncbi:MAG: rhodanese-like domain-containing protein [Gammaproteobacteria bacterium]|nr:rhodanese-like domain-containing protein [Gammaproteobacteria bacterium]NIM74669.1 rhodanese-like domain-containing protein [Gammaproteobacteria bacterium]NIN37446.1 rhodanese-like domain-containing protein [Gammaproteobacteria bacterium]NIO26502.1 rhodanese-like domain-containing protein [Gammaproteobacteria bacterium]NIO67054.1 rhodanese-like domain-containing protein [Gammaproteobacteria bacterium]
MIRAPLSVVSPKRACLSAAALWLAVLGAPSLAWASHLETTLAQRLLVERLQRGEAPLLVDVRTPGEYQSGHVPGAVNIPLQELQRRLEELRPYRNTELVLYCETGVRAGHAGRFLEQQGFTELRALQGHMSAWRSAGLPAER